MSKGNELVFTRKPDLMHVVVEPLSQLWWGGLLSSSILIILLLLLFKYLLHAYQLPFMKTLSLMLFFLVFMVITMHYSLERVGAYNTIYHFTYVEYLLL